MAEILDIDFSGDGEHDWLYVEKTGANTHWVAEQLARCARVRTGDVGYAGLKDRHAITSQWFSVRRPGGSGTDWSSLAVEGVRIVELKRHSRKLKRGAHRGNRFCISVRSGGIVDDEVAIGDRLRRIAKDGVPNYFGEQRFGRGGANIALGQAALAGARLPRHKRSIGISALRSLEFNRELDARVRNGTWNRLLPGDVAGLDGSGSIFAVAAVDAELERRCGELDIHPTGVLPALELPGVNESRRPLRARVADLRWEITAGILRLDFTLGRGSYATAVLREIGRFTAGDREEHVDSEADAG